jgi:endonuclease/exonuclease/phosphatase family metal-dependent hydrolase
MVPEFKFSILTYNVWYGDDYKQRMKQIIGQIKDKLPDVVGLQEVIHPKETADMLREIGYKVVMSSTPRPYRELVAVNPKVFNVISDKVITFPTSQMGRELLVVELLTQSTNEIQHRIHVGVSHLESMFQFQQERMKQLSIVFRELSKLENAYFLADTNLSIDAALKLPKQWTDAFIDAGSPPKHKYTYVSKTNPHIITRTAHNMSKRYDRIFSYTCKAQIASFTLFGIDRPQSDHYGVLVAFTVPK